MSTTKPIPAPEGTHHLIGSAPAYARRFDEVLAFHPPGLAPVRRGSEAWHIRTDGSDAYTRRFVRTFGFYEGIAAVVSKDGWHHIDPEGRDRYPHRFDWCGNFQGGLCSVRDVDNAYFHITGTGAPAYAGRWRYAGDFRDGIGVVQGLDGRSTHILSDGTLLHGRWFLDLDVFHKGFARARDDDGWTHVDRAGMPAYSRRFAAVEPFYNGQARVERFDGGLEVIAEDGAPMAELRPARQSDFADLSRDMVGFWRTQAVAAAVEVGVFECLPSSSRSVADDCGLDPERAARLLRALGEMGLVQLDGETWSATPKGGYLTRDAPLTLADAAMEYACPFSAAWRALPQTLRAGSGWRAGDIFVDIARDPRRLAPHHRMLGSYALHDYAAIPGALALDGSERVIDAGGGVGVLARLLLDHHPGLDVTVLDLPEVVAHASGDPRSRLSWKAGDLFSPWGIDGDVVILARVLHDWADREASLILRHAREALPAGGRLFVVEMVLPEAGFAGALCDLHLLLATGGQERAESAYRKLMDEAGFTLTEVRRIPALPSILVAAAR